jgi:hypothetical protein
MEAKPRIYVIMEISMETIMEISMETELCIIAIVRVSEVFTYNKNNNRIYFLKVKRNRMTMVML